MIRIKPFRQSPAHCGPASLKMILNYYGIRMTEKRLARILRCTADGTSTLDLIHGAKKLGFKAFYKDYATFRDIKKLVKNMRIPVIVEWFETDESHYSVVINIDRRNIYLIDPYIGRKRQMKLNRFMNVWFSFDSSMPRKEDVALRRMIVVSREWN